MNELMDLKERMEHERPAQWHELPDIALYMDQIIAYMPRQLIRFDDREALTSAIVNNYIKDGLVPHPPALPHGGVRPEEGALRAGHRHPAAGGGGAEQDAGGALSIFLRRFGSGPQRYRRRH